MSTFTARTFTNVFTDARSAGWLNDISADRHTDAVLLPAGSFAYNEIQEEFAVAGIPRVETVSDTFAYVAEADSISIPGGITDFAEPLELWEKSTANALWNRMRLIHEIDTPLETSLDRLYY